MSEEKPIIGTAGICIIIPAKTGIIYCNQVGGYACHQIEIEGYIIPLPPTFFVKLKEGEKSNCDNPYWSKYYLQEHFDKLFAPLDETTKYQGHCYSDGIDEADAEYIEKAVSRNDFMDIKVDMCSLRDCEEAKIYVYVDLKQYDEHNNEVEPLRIRGILTWENSD